MDDFEEAYYLDLCSEVASKAVQDQVPKGDSGQGNLKETEQVAHPVSSTAPAFRAQRRSWREEFGVAARPDATELKRAPCVPSAISHSNKKGGSEDAVKIVKQSISHAAPRLLSRGHGLVAEGVQEEVADDPAPSHSRDLLARQPRAPRFGSGLSSDVGSGSVVRPAKANDLEPLPPSPTTEGAAIVGSGIAPALDAVAASAHACAGALSSALAAPSAILVLADLLFRIDASGALHCTDPCPEAVETAFPIKNTYCIVSTGVDPLASVLNTYATRCLRPYQRIGVAWMLWRLRQSGGAILGDDMGLGKTCQTAALIAAILGKTGTRAMDDLDFRRAQGAGHRSTPLDCSVPGPQFRQPILILMPKAVLKNWARELSAWGWFVVRQLGGHQSERLALLSDVKVRVVLQQPF